MYWAPLYSFVRSRGYTVHDAQDLTQSFFAYLIEHKIYARVDRQKGRFRSFLLDFPQKFSRRRLPTATERSNAAADKIFFLCMKSRSKMRSRFSRLIVLRVVKIESSIVAGQLRWSPLDWNGSRQITKVNPRRSSSRN